MNAYVEVPRDRMEALLAGAGFQPDRVGKELVYKRAHDKDDRLSVAVYTSIAFSAGSTRSCGEDAIRVVALFTWTHRASGQERRKNLYKARVYRVNSVDGVIARTLEKMREAYATCNEFIKGTR